MLDETDVRSLVADLEQDDDFDPFRYRPPGPVSQSFLNNQRDLTQFLMGPVGGGKTTTCAFKRVLAATLMPPDKKGLRRSRWVVVRTSFRDADRTVLKSWQQWFPKTYPGSSWQGGNDRPVTHVLRWRMLDGTTVEAETIFIGLGEHRISEVLRGLEISGAWLNEADTLGDDALAAVEQRVGRYPARVDLADPSLPRHRQVIGDLNAPDEDNWVHSTFMENAKPNRVLYAQPSGRHPDAENLGNLEAGYYENMVETQEDWFVRRFVDNLFGYSRDGKPVFPSFDRARHVAARDIAPDPGLLTLIGLDAGLHPAAMIGQVTPRGQIRITDELYLGHGYGADRFGEALLDLLDRRGYPARSSSAYRAWADPASQYGADREGGELAWYEAISAVLGIAVQIPISNELSLRIGAVSQELRHSFDDGSPRLIVSPHCKMTIRALSSAYRYKKRIDGQYDPVPEKNAASHPMDGLQYLVLGYRGRAGVVREAGAGGRVADRSPPMGHNGGPPLRAGGFDPHRVGLGGGWGRYS
ncbi:hypothetical protein MKI84_12940 [Ancylobacter sp. A5.8]|uniref:hypothetical protein n=1 Tax=Ancylobacter gelatini TaxID=2919920 RepID=UPI001F4D9459|nr:hypothetical protein [Ancylobacter gelatini]MCJ8143823.1 hypothetical protein [Ancylobacter gelatini]